LVEPVTSATFPVRSKSMMRVSLVVRRLFGRS
jgi:hypothetical protein